MPDVGDRAPDFALPSTDGEVRLSDRLKDARVLLAFYFEDATPTCSTEVASLKDARDALRELGADVIAVSADGLESHRQFAERLGGLPFPLVSDPQMEAARAYDAVAEDDPRRSRRALFAIEQNGTISYAANPFSPNNLSQLEGAFRALGLEL
ncbi:MAG: redoxin domain-containing protein [Dehalococcoidia bacterium]|nr:redoxin domain-containing protein [Dehalococcoidia bacterium]